MKGKQLFVLLLLAVAAGGAYYYLAKDTNSSWSESGGGGGKVITFPLNDVASIKIKDAGEELTLAKKGDNWVVPQRADYPANFEKVSGLLRKMWELKTGQVVKVGESQMDRLELGEPGKGGKSATEVEFFGADGKSLGALLLGKRQMRKQPGGGPEEGAGMGMGMSANTDGLPIGRYVKPVGGTKVSLVSEIFDDVDPKPQLWVSSDFIKVDAPKSIAVEGTTDAKKWTLTREGANADWQLAGAKPGEQLDPGKMFAYGNILSEPKVADVMGADAKPEENGLDKPTRATIQTFEGFTYALKIGKGDGNSIPLQVNVTANFPKERAPQKDEKPEEKTKRDEEFQASLKGLEERLANEQKFAGKTFLVPQFSVDPLLKDRAGLFAEQQPPDQAPGMPAGMPPGMPRGAALPFPQAPAGASLPAPAPAPAPMPPAATSPVSTPEAPAPAPAPEVKPVTPPPAPAPADAKPAPDAPPVKPPSAEPAPKPAEEATPKPTEPAK